ncbi:MAG TPA: hypothetical protein VK277_10410 [Acidimicrobiales bacterium]|nr:hypothetical protein [Acidimicrobiales bacterium]
MPRRRAQRPLKIGSSHWRADGQPKTRFGSEREARVAAAERAEEGGVELVVYECDFCTGWHMGRPSGRDD